MKLHGQAFLAGLVQAVRRPPYNMDAAAHRKCLQKREEMILPWICNPLVHLFPDEPQDKLMNAKSKRMSRLELHVEEADEIEAATPIELFYDLFFVANLTTVTSVHFITETRSLASYVLFFIILWFTWLHTTLYDVRFAIDSVYERTCKAIHFAIMVGFGSVSTTWDPFDPDGKDTRAALRTMTIALMASRIVLGIQYAVVMFYAWRRKKPMVPLAVHCSAMIVAFLIYLELFLTNRVDESDTKFYIGWYIVIIFEVVVTLVAASIWPIVSFIKTHLVERMGLLTLIVMGEGIIVMLKAVNAVVKATGWDSSMVGIVVSAVAVIYLYWMFYFDYNPHHAHYGTVRQCIWTLLHFPYHLALVLSAEGLRQFTTFYSFLSGVTRIDYTIADSPDIEKLTEWFGTVFEHFYDEGSSETILKDYPEIMSDLKVLEATNTTVNKTVEILAWMVDEVFVGYSEYVGIHVDSESSTPKGNLTAPVVDISPTEDPTVAPFQAVLSLYELVFNYFFSSLGVIFVMYGCFAILVRSKKDTYDYLSIALRFVTAVVFYGMLGIRRDWNEYNHYLGSPWIVPTVCIILFVVAIMDKTINAFAYKKARENVKNFEVTSDDSSGSSQLTLCSTPSLESMGNRRAHRVTFSEVSLA